MFNATSIDPTKRQGREGSFARLSLLEKESKRSTKRRRLQSLIEMQNDECTWLVFVVNSGLLWLWMKDDKTTPQVTNSSSSFRWRLQVSDRSCQISWTISSDSSLSLLIFLNNFWNYKKFYFSFQTLITKLFSLFFYRDLVRNYFFSYFW